MTFSLKPKYECDRCSTVHEHEAYAELCCPTDINVVYECPECGELYGTMDPALNCCPEPGALDSRGPTGPELEAQGQMRLEITP